MQLEDLRKNIKDMSTEELLKLHDHVREMRRRERVKPTPKVRKAKKEKARGKMDGLTPEQLEQLKKMLEEKGLL